jgi:Polyketide cyclase / dehydrase and lipid transport
MGSWAGSSNRPLTWTREVPEIRVSATSIVSAPAPVVYGILADYREGHPAILPRRYFEGLEVETGGHGAGTRIRFKVRAFGSVRSVRADVSEPVPGRELVETDVATGAATRFLVEPVSDGRASRVTFETTWCRGGLGGWAERWLAPRYLRKVYRAELALLNEEAQARVPHHGVSG